MIHIKNCPICGAENPEAFLDLKDFFLSQEAFRLQQCKSCGFVYTSPRPDENSLPKYYDSPEYLSHHSGGFNPIHLIYQGLRNINIRRKYSLVNRYSSNGALLDIGCGTGEVLHYFQKRKWSVKGIEPSEQARNFAVENYGLNVKDEGDLRTFEEHSFDVISMWHVLEHVPDLHGRIDTVRKLLKSSGYLIIALPNLNSWDAKHYKDYWAAYDVPRHLHHFSKKAITDLVVSHQFEIIESVPMKLDAYFISMLSEKYIGKHNRYLYGAINGLRSNRSAKKTGEFSSLIYIFKKK